MPVHAAKAFIFDAAGKVLILRCSETHPYFANYDDLPGGIFAPGETPEQGILREIEEETGLKIASSQLTLLDEFAQKDGSEWFVFTAQLSKMAPEITISAEHDMYEWLTRDELFARPLMGRGRLHDLAVNRLRG